MAESQRYRTLNLEQRRQLLVDEGLKRVKYRIGPDTSVPNKINADPHIRIQKGILRSNLLKGSTVPLCYLYPVIQSLRLNSAVEQGEKDKSWHKNGDAELLRAVSELMGNVIDNMLLATEFTGQRWLTLNGEPKHLTDLRNLIPGYMLMYHSLYDSRTNGYKFLLYFIEKSRKNNNYGGNFLKFRHTINPYAREGKNYLSMGFDFFHTQIKPEEARDLEFLLNPKKAIQSLTFFGHSENTQLNYPGILAENFSYHRYSVPNQTGEGFSVHTKNILSSINNQLVKKLSTLKTGE